jgi:hypothetical protein
MPGCLQWTYIHGFIQVIQVIHGLQDVHEAFLNLLALLLIHDLIIIVHLFTLLVSILIDILITVLATILITILCGNL